jgi:hypothetical protein
MSFKLTQAFIYTMLKTFCFYLGFFSIGASIYLWLDGNTHYEIFVFKLYQEHAALFVGLWAPTSFLLYVIFDRMIDKYKKENK